MSGPDPINDQLPTEDGGHQPYKAAGKLAGKKALITGGDSGIGRAIAILYAMEGAESTIVYTPEEEADAKKTEGLVKEKGGQIHLLQADLRKHQECKRVVEKAVEAMGKINILALNHGTQEMKETIGEVSEYVFPPKANKIKHLLTKTKQRAMDRHLLHKHPPLLLPLQIRPPRHVPRRHNHNLCLRKLFYC